MLKTLWVYTSDEITSIQHALGKNSVLIISGMMENGRGKPRLSNEIFNTKKATPLIRLEPRISISVAHPYSNYTLHDLASWPCPNLP